MDERDEMGLGPYANCRTTWLMTMDGLWVAGGCAGGTITNMGAMYSFSQPSSKPQSTNAIYSVSRNPEPEEDFNSPGTEYRFVYPLCKSKLYGEHRDLEATKFSMTDDKI